MITSVEVENFRGIERLSVAGLGRVNLVIGKNNSGKTALMEAVGMATFPESAGEHLGSEQFRRMPDADVGDFDRFWRPLFRSEDAERGFLLRATREPGAPIHLEVRKPRGERVITGGHPSNPSSPLRPSAWVLEYELKASGKSERFEIARHPDSTVTFPSGTYVENSYWWVVAGTPELPGLIGALSELKQEGRDGQVRDLLRHLDERIESLEILSPKGKEASLFVRIAGEPKLLPFEMMGEGVRRCFDLSLGFVLDNVVFIAADEFENGLHHSTLEPVWTWLARVSANRNVQVFATTHSEECVQAASRAFSVLNDDGLRVIRLERQPHQTAATVYDRNLVEAAGRMGVELRG